MMTFTVIWEKRSVASLGETSFVTWGSVKVKSIHKVAGKVSKVKPVVLGLSFLFLLIAYLLFFFSPSRVLRTLPLVSSLSQY